MNISFLQKHKLVFKALGVEAIILFGSQTTGKINNLSDVDIGVIFAKPEKYKNNTNDVYLKLYDVLTDVLPRAYLQRRFKLREHEVDIVFLQFAPIYLQHKALQDGKIIYQSQVGKDKILTYKENVSRSFLDLRHFFNLRFQAILERS